MSKRLRLRSWRVQVRLLARLAILSLVVLFGSYLYSASSQPTRSDVLDVAVVGDFSTSGSFAQQVWDGAEAATRAINSSAIGTAPPIRLTRANLGDGGPHTEQRLLLQHLARHRTDIIIDAAYSDTSEAIGSIVDDLGIPRLISVATNYHAEAPLPNSAIRLPPNNDNQAQAIAEALGQSDVLMLVHRSSYGRTLAAGIVRAINGHPGYIEYDDDISQVWMALQGQQRVDGSLTLVVIGYHRQLAALITAFERAPIPDDSHVILSDGFFDDSIQQQIPVNTRHRYSLAFPAAATVGGVEELSRGFAGYGHDAIMLAYLASRLREVRPASAFINEVSSVPRSAAIADLQLSQGSGRLLKRYHFNLVRENDGSQFSVISLVPKGSR